MTLAPAVGCGRGGTEVGLPSVGRQLGCKPFELAAADVFEILSRGIVRGLLVEEHRDVEPCGHLGGDVARQRDAIGHRHVLDRDEGHDVDGADARVLARMRPEVDRGNSGVVERENRGLHRGLVADERDHRPVVRAVGRMVEHAHAGRGADGGDDPLDDLGPAAFADVGDRLDDRHGSLYHAAGPRMWCAGRRWRCQTRYNPGTYTTSMPATTLSA